MGLRRSLGAGPPFVHRLIAHPRDPPCHIGQRQHQDEIVVGRDAVMPLDATTETAMHYGVLAIGADERSYGRHRATAGTGAVAGQTVVHMSRVQTDGTVIAVSPAARHGPDEDTAVPAAKLFRPIWSLPACGGAHPRAFRRQFALAGRSALTRFPPRRGVLASALAAINAKVFVTG